MKSVKKTGEINTYTMKLRYSLLNYFTPIIVRFQSCVTKPLLTITFSVNIFLVLLSFLLGVFLQKHDSQEEVVSPPKASLFCNRINLKVL